LLVQGGAVCLGSTSMDEFGMGSLGTNVVTSTGHQPTKNPIPFLERIGKRDMSDDDLLGVLHLDPSILLEAHHAAIHNGPAFSAGGSSCGSAASVAHGSSVVSLGTDTGGSVRLPAAWCNIVGLKPTFGLLSRHGLVSYASSLDCPGILASSADCTGLVLDLLMCLHTERDSVMDQSAERSPVYDYLVTADETLSNGQPLRGFKVGIPAAFSIQECPETVLDAWENTASALEDLGATVEIVQNDLLSPDIVQKALSAYYVLACAEASSNLARYDGFRYGAPASGEEFTANLDHLSLLEQQYTRTRSTSIGAEVTRRILSGTAVLSSDRFHIYYEAAAQLRADLTKQLHMSLKAYDMLLVPSCVFPPVTLDGIGVASEMVANDIMTVPASLAGVTAMVVCNAQKATAASASGIQLIGARFAEGKLLRAATALERKEELQKFL
jgi:aspartyl-tRNA(Asn)/glutamyl-tRNA(Gln) amidotransferase subunit A